MPPPLPLAFEDALRQYEGLLRRVARLYCADADDQQDLYQETLVQLWRAWSSYEGRAQRSTWVYRVALNVAVVQQRQRNRRPLTRSLDQAAVRQLAAPAAPGPDADELAQLYQAIGHLSDVDKALVLLRLEDRPDQEVAEILGITPNNVRVKMHRALDKLRRLMAH
ncbi:sigma-70 family RNA polymerase sigma factor [Hymenobacter sp. BT664]|uniref:Sigma-70 family RNA polymerase sigma factor n=1 Tax=Hymenobacter montanus TaxID=2771359 RepID=A0A927GJD5_9BACT|nr:sigma-70 family RNA polymerase sigma factor [Hymenobacter montanus]MBD2768295.1 sigma-70 family RNA polymerase sigma factor [Hymenobacter montanus]